MTGAEYQLHLNAIRNKRRVEKGLLPDVPRQFTKQYRWCAPAGERFPYLVAKGYKPVEFEGALVWDNELLLCAKSLSAKDTVFKLWDVVVDKYKEMTE